MHAHHTDDLLKAAGLRTTEQRVLVLNTLVQAGVALSHGELEKRLGMQLDRVTLYRTLKTFEDKGITHTVPDKKDGVKYALCSHSCSTAQHQHNHLHFTCRLCHDTYCLENVVIPAISLPAGYQLEEANLVAQGLCNRCG